MDIPETRYAKTTDGVRIAYQAVGNAAVDLVFLTGWTSHLEMMWQDPRHARFLSRLASFSRLILFDKRGMGLSDRVPDDRLPPLEVRMDDARAVMDAADPSAPSCWASPKMVRWRRCSPRRIRSGRWR